MLSGQLGLDKKWSQAFSRLDPHLGVMDYNEPFTVSDAIKIPEPVISTANHWLLDGLALAGLEVE